MLITKLVVKPNAIGDSNPSEGKLRNFDHRDSGGDRLQVATADGRNLDSKSNFDTQYLSLMDRDWDNGMCLSA